MNVEPLVINPNGVQHGSLGWKPQEIDYVPQALKGRNTNLNLVTPLWGFSDFNT